MKQEPQVNFQLSHKTWNGLKLLRVWNVLHFCYICTMLHLSNRAIFDIWQLSYKIFTFRECQKNRLAPLQPRFSCWNEEWFQGKSFPQHVVTQLTASFALISTCWKSIKARSRISIMTHQPKVIFSVTFEDIQNVNHSIAQRLHWWVFSLAICIPLPCHRSRKQFS